MKKLLSLLMTLMIGIGIFTLVGGVNTVYAADIASGTYDDVSWRITDAGELILGNGGTQTLRNRTTRQYTSWPWHTYYNQITSIKTSGVVKLQGSLNSMFFYDNGDITIPRAERVGYLNCLSIDLSTADFSGVTNMSYMFCGMPNLTNITFPSEINTYNNENLNFTFSGCEKLQNLDVSSMNTSKVTSMGATFYLCKSLSSVDVSRWDTTQVTNLGSMFSGCANLEYVDISSFDTHACTSFANMFNGCSNLTEIDLSSFSTSLVTITNSMFKDCSNLKHLDLSNFDTTSVTNMNNMFCGCSSLETIDVSNFDTSNVTTMYGIFNDCSSLKELDLSSFSTSSLLNNVREEYVIYYRGMFENCSSLERLLIPDFDTSQCVTLEDTFNNCNNLKEVHLSPTFYFNGNAITDDTMKAILPIPVGEQYTGKWIREDKVFGPYTSAELRDNYTPAMSGTWIWELVPVDYTLSFAAGEHGTGAMAPVTALAKEDFTLPANQFVAFGYDFDHWDDGNGKTYADKGIIPANTYAADTKITLTAVFKKRDTSLNWDGNEATFSIRGGEQAVLDNIPAGTSYQVYELTPDGWVLVQQENSSGVIEALEESAAAFWNKYQPGVTTVQFSGLKNLDGRPAEAGKFTFELYEGETLVDTATTQDGGFIQFKVIEYDAAGDHVYTIREVDPNDDSIDYDTHEETVEVSVTDNGDGTLSSEVTYDDDGIVFSNATRPGTLRITKDATNGTSANANDKFTIEIEFRNESGMPINDNIYWYIEGDSSPSDIDDGNQE